jgi:hypothetical protein
MQRILNRQRRSTYVAARAQENKRKTPCHCPSKSFVLLISQIRFNTVLSYSYEQSNDSDIQSYLDDVQANSLYAIVSLKVNLFTLSGETAEKSLCLLVASTFARPRTSYPRSLRLCCAHLCRPLLGRGRLILDRWVFVALTYVNLCSAADVLSAIAMSLLLSWMSYPLSHTAFQYYSPLTPHPPPLASPSVSLLRAPL